MARLRTTLRLVLLAFGLSACAAAAQDMQIGPVTKLPLPRFATLKSDRVNVREGPSKDHRTRWVYRRPGLPVEIIAEFETWRRIRDHEGGEGWVLHSLLSGKRTAMVAGQKDAAWLPLRAQPLENAPLVAKLEPGVIGRIRSCDARWCRIEGDNFDGWIAQATLWGVYPPEKLRN